MKKFPNGFDSWVEIYTEMILYASAQVQNKPVGYDLINFLEQDSRVWSAHEGDGFVAVVELAKEWADEFEELNKDREWDGEFWEEAPIFARCKDLELDYKIELEAYYQDMLDRAEQAAKEPVLVVCAFYEGKDLYVPKDKLNILKLQRLVHVRDTGYSYFIEDLEKIKNILNDEKER